MFYFNKADKDLEQEKLLELYSVSSCINRKTDLNVSKIVSEDCMTQRTMFQTLPPEVELSLLNETTISELTFNNDSTFYETTLKDLRNYV